MSLRTGWSQAGHDPHLHRRRHVRAGDGARRGQQPRHADQDAGERWLRRGAGHLRQAPRQSRQQGRRPGTWRRQASRRARCCASFAVDAEALAKLKAGEIVSVETFAVGQQVDVTGTTKGRGFAGVIKRHHFSSNRASHGNSLSHNKPGSISMAQDPGRVFPGKRMAGHLGDAHAHRAEARGRPRGRRSAGCCWSRARVPGADGGHILVRPSVKTASEERGLRMELKLIDESGKPAATLAASDSLFGRDYNEALVHQVVTAFQANARSGNRAQKSRGEINKSHKKPWQQKGTGRARAGQANSPLWRGGGKIFPSRPDENFSQKVNRKMYRAGVASILSQLVREGRLSVIESSPSTPRRPSSRAEDQGDRVVRGAGRHRQGRREPVPVVAQPSQRAGARGAGSGSGEPDPLRERRCSPRRRWRKIRGDAGMSTPKTTAPSVKFDTRSA